MPVDYNDLHFFDEVNGNRHRESVEYLEAILCKLNDLNNNINDIKRHLGLETVNTKQIKVRKFVDGVLEIEKIFDSDNEAKEFVNQDVLALNDRLLILHDMPRQLNGFPVRCVVLTGQTNLSDTYKTVTIPEQMIIEYKFY